ncbi:AAA family ATPase [Colletotrichum truncatum]|uniref:AAA family ATPase n=1 Tax=Colletotrichum truncatum TaxID=5467 RepID=A0ACC3ZL15_COLTU
MDTINTATERQTAGVLVAHNTVDDVDTGKASADPSASPSKQPDADHKSSDRSTTSQKKPVTKKPKKLAKTKTKKPKKPTLADDTSESATDDVDSDTDSFSSSDSDSDALDVSSADDSKRKSKSKKDSVMKKSKKAPSGSRAKKTKKSKKRAAVKSDSSDSSDSSDTESISSDDEDGLTKVSMTPQQIQLFQQWQRSNDALSYGNNTALAVGQQFMPPPTRRAAPRLGLLDGGNMLDANPLLGKRMVPPSQKKKTKLDYKRVDQVWDSTIHNFKLQDTAETTSDSQYDGYVLQIRRTFDWEGKYKTTIVDIKSKILRECLQDVIGNIKGVSLVDEAPKLDPNLLFLYLEDLRHYCKKLKKTEPTSSDKKERKKQQKHIDNKRLHLKVLLKYLDKDYAHIKKSLYPMLENGLITFDLLWALWKPNTLVYTTTYGTHDEARVFKVEQAERHNNMLKGEFYWVDGKYFEFDGKQFGYGSFAEEVPEFRGARKITSLNAYPLDYHKNKESVMAAVIERGKKFVQLGGVHYQSHEGLAYYKKKKSIIKVNINGRIMVDPAVHRRINPNYQVSAVRPKDHDVMSEDEETEDEKSQHDSEEGCCGSDDGGDEKMVKKVVRDPKGRITIIQVPKSEIEEPTAAEQPLGRLEDETRKETAEVEDSSENIPKDAEEEEEALVFSDEEYLIASPVVLGFSFSEKLWLEFTVSGVKEIQWNETAYESLVLEPKQKDIVKALVESHKYHATESIDDVIQGKGKGLVAVLHGPPGTGKTLTAEGISELLKCPLYMASAGELGTDSRYLEQELQKILDICHAWGAILLLDEADVFMEKRNLHEINRNALVSIFLRQLEYFQGILFLTTNRVETFDDAFQSRIHIALRYDSLTMKAKKTIFKIFMERVRVLEKIDLMPFSEEDYNDLAKYDLNGRQIKNTIRTAQALAVNKGEALSMEHIRQVLDVQKSFDIHLKGGTGYQDALRSYY